MAREGPGRRPRTRARGERDRIAHRRAGGAAGRRPACRERARDAARPAFRRRRRAARQAGCVLCGERGSDPPRAAARICARERDTTVRAGRAAHRSARRTRGSAERARRRPVGCGSGAGGGHRGARAHCGRRAACARRHARAGGGRRRRRAQVRRIPATDRAHRAGAARRRDAPRQRRAGARGDRRAAQAPRHRACIARRAAGCCGARRRRAARAGKRRARRQAEAAGRAAVDRADAPGESAPGSGALAGGEQDTRRPRGARRCARRAAGEDRPGQGHGRLAVRPRPDAREAAMAGDRHRAGLGGCARGGVARAPECDRACRARRCARLGTRGRDASGPHRRLCRSGRFGT